ncbi:MAG: cell division protein FtsA [Verrucomicrobiota bacterium]
MGKDSIVVGLEIGTSKICVVVGETKGDGTLSIIGVGQAPSRGVRKGEIVDFDTAQKCVREALVDAEEKSDVMIESVYLAITGSHISSFNNRGVVNIPEDQEEIEEPDCELVQTSAKEVSLPAQNAFIHSILQHYYVDGQEGILNPVGLMGGRLEADFHIIHGVRTRIQNTIRCVKELDIEVEDIVFNPYAAAQVVLGQNDKNLGALVIDIGGGTTDYIVYVEGVVKQSGVLAVGGDHINNDISMGLRIPLARAEKLKIEEGSAILGNNLPGETVLLKDDHGFVGKEIERETLNTIIHMRVREMLEMLRRKLEEESYLELLGAGIFITGGTSQLKGINHLAEEIFELPVHLTHAQTVAGVTAVSENPQFSTAIGLIRYAQAMQPGRRGGFFTRMTRLFKRSR